MARDVTRAAPSRPLRAPAPSGSLCRRLLTTPSFVSTAAQSASQCPLRGLKGESAQRLAGAPRARGATVDRDPGEGPLSEHSRAGLLWDARFEQVTPRFGEEAAR